MEIRAAYDTHVRRQVDVSEGGLTRQSMQDECDINVIMAQYKKSGLLSHVKEHGGDYGEFLAMDFHSAMNAVLEAEEMFATVPSEIRAQFENDPGRFLSFVSEAENEEEMRTLGLLPAKVAAVVQPPEVPPATENRRKEDAKATEESA